MKKLMAFLCAMVLLLTGCIQRGLPTAPDELIALQEFEFRLECAAVAEDLKAIKLDDIVVTDANIIDRWLKTLQNLDLEAVPFNGGVNGERGYVLSFVYPTEEVQLGVFFSQQIDLYYNGAPAEYTLIIRNEDDTSLQLRELAKESGIDFRLF